MDADASTRIAVIESKHWAFEKTPDAPLGVVVERKLARREKLSRSATEDTSRVDQSFQSEAIFDKHYNPRLHKRNILRELRYGIGRPWFGRHKKKSRRFARHQLEAAARWREAILRDAPMLKGFFADEPGWREKALLWCEKALAAGPDSDRSR
jgi:hypothetical protein